VASAEPCAASFACAYLVRARRKNESGDGSIVHRIHRATLPLREGRNLRVRDRRVLQKVIKQISGRGEPESLEEWATPYLNRQCLRLRVIRFGD
jgi:hypothetical protein